MSWNHDGSPVTFGQLDDLDKIIGLHKRIRELEAERDELKRVALMADKLLGNVERHFANGSNDDGVDLWRRISDHRRGIELTRSSNAKTE